MNGEHSAKQLEREQSPDLAAGFSQLEDAIERRLVESNELAPKPIWDEKGRVKGISYVADIGEEVSEDYHIWRTVRVVLPCEGPTVYEVDIDDCPLADSARWTQGDTSASYLEQASLTGPQQRRDVTADQLTRASWVVESGRLVDPAKERVEMPLVDHGGFVEMTEVIEPVETPKKRSRRFFGRIGCGTDKAIR